MTTKAKQAGEFEVALAAARAQLIAQECSLVTTSELAAIARYSGVTGAFRDWLADIGLQHLPGRPGIFDLKKFRTCLDHIQGNTAPAACADAPISLTERRKMRREGKCAA